MPLFSRRDRALVPVNEDLRSHRRAMRSRDPDHGELALFDPFADFASDSMAMSLFGSPTDTMQRMFGMMERDFGMLSPFGGGMNGLFGGMSFPGDGMYQSQTVCMSTTVGPDGQPRVEKYASSAAGNSVEQVHEIQEMYTNSHTGVDKMAMEREIAGKGRRVVKQRNRHTGEEKMDDEIRGMTDAETFDFDRQWETAQQRLPARPNVRRAVEGLNRVADRFAVQGAPVQERHAVQQPAQPALTYQPQHNSLASRHGARVPVFQERSAVGAHHRSHRR